ncbi:MAG: outer membrane lipoprotein carrier protein LolA [Cyclobacteriaceae bacterium]|nr:outer membrane lipoprotein carrier protein LolA [Cyclobacteriaceae bacterium]
MMIKIIIFLACLTGFFMPVMGQYEKDALVILDQMSEEYKNLISFKADFTYALENKMEDIQEEFSGNIIVKGDKFQLDLGDQVIFNDGEIMWTFLRDVNEVNIDYYLPEDGDMTPSNIFTAYKDGYKYMVAGEEKVGSQDYDIIDLVPDDPNKPFYKVKLWINKKDHTLKQWKLFDKSGNTYLYDIVNFNNSYDARDSEFVFEESKHPGVEMIDLR